MVFYFTATGNSLYVAKCLDNYPISIAQIKNAQAFEDDNIGIVCPVYCGEIPKTVFEFIKKSTFKTPYLYLVLTYGMSESDCPEFTFNQCEKQGVTIDYIGGVRMVDNYLPAFDMNEQKQMNKNIPAQLEALEEDIRNRRKYIPVATDEGRKLHKRVAMMNKVFPSANNGSFLKITNKCVGCKICENVCPIGNITVENGHARRINKKCEFCLACIQLCPKGAISLKSERNPNARYINENISLDEIIKANRQRR